MDKRLITLLMFVGGAVGGYVPALWGDDGFTMSAVLFSGIGAMLGVWIGWRITR
jgi:hypothetical protein